MGERWRRRATTPRVAAPRPIPARTPDAGLIGWREIRTFLDPGTAVSGKLSFATPTRIEGRLRGEVRASDLLVIAAGGVVHGTIWARSLVVAGEVRGEVRGAERVEIQAGGKVVGRVETQRFVLPEGAFFEGECRMGMTPELLEDAPKPAPARA